MSFKDKINLDYNDALKSKDKSKISTYRLILSGIKDLDISNRSGPNKKETDDEDIKKLLKKMIKQRSESIEIYMKNNRQDLLKIEEDEKKILSSSDHIIANSTFNKAIKNNINVQITIENILGYQDIINLLNNPGRKYSLNLFFKF